MKNPNRFKLLIFLATTMAFVACQTAPKAEISSSANPREEIERLTVDLRVAQEGNVDVLARKDYLKSYKFLEQAKEDLNKGKDRERIIDDLRFGRESLRNAYATVENHKYNVPGLFEARQKAIKAGAHYSSELKSEWNSLDEDVSAHADKIESVTPDKLEKYQNRYVELEKKAVIETQLGKAKVQIKDARKDGAEKIAPEALRVAEISVNNAESLIGSNLSNPSGYGQSVHQANVQANYLLEVVETVRQSGTPLTEAAASRILSQKRQITHLRKDLSTSEETVSDVEYRLDEKNKTLAAKDSTLRKRDIALSAAQSSIAIQNAMEKSRQQFLPNEAEAYQQGGNLLIRLKSMNFQSGHAELPTHSLALLAKISEVAKSLKAKEIRIEGHTDSSGTMDTNKKLSEQRATAVATYFKENGFEGTQVLSEGHGFEKPIATNKSKEGRAQNRRVDIIITPLDSSTIKR